MKGQIHILITFAAFIIATEAYDYSFNATTITDVSTAPYLERGNKITCEIVKTERNVSYTLNNQEFEEYFDTTSANSKTISINDDCWRFDILRPTNKLQGAKFRILNAFNELSYYFILFEHGVQIYTLPNRPEEIELDEYIEVKDLLPTGVKTEFSIEFQLYNSDFSGEVPSLIFTSTRKGAIKVLPGTLKSYPRIMVIEGQYATPAQWTVKNCFNSTKTLYFDKFRTVCSNSTNNNDTESNNSTSTYFTTLIETQYQLQRVMENDLGDFKKWHDDQMIKELIEEFLSDVKDNYSAALQTHRVVLRFFKLNKYEANLKSKYLSDNVFRNIRRDYFDLYKRAQLIFSRFR